MVNGKCNFIEPNQRYQKLLASAVKKTGMKEGPLCRLFLRQGLDRWAKDGVLKTEEPAAVNG